MRTRWELVLPLAQSDTPADVRAAGEEALRELEQAEQMLSAFRPDSDLYRLNHQAQTGGPVSVPGGLFAFLRYVQTLCRETNGAFDPAIGPLVALWERAGQNGRTPTPKEIADAKALADMTQNAVLDEVAKTVNYLRPGVRLNMGAVGKGWAADKAMESLRENGITSALLHGGTSTVLGLNTPPENETGWAVAIQHPLLPNEHLGVVHLRNAALGVSAVHGKTFWAEGGRTFGHVLDARTGYPVENNLLAAVISPFAADADALSTALLVRGKAGFSSFADQFPNAGFLAAEKEADNSSDGNFKSLRIWTTPHFFI